MTETLNADVVIVGSGPAGYTAAIYSARAGSKTVVVAGGVTAGGALMNTTLVENYPGFKDGVLGPDLMEEFKDQAERFGVEVIYDDAVRLDLTGDIKTVETDYSGVITARGVILSMGSEHRKLGIPGEDRLDARGISYCGTCDGPLFRGKNVIVVGGGDTAAEDASFLAKFAQRVTVVHRRDTLRASKAMQDRLFDNPKITFKWNTTVEEYNGENSVQSVTLKESNGSVYNFPVEGVFVAIGHDPRNTLVKDVAVLDEDGYVVVERDGKYTTRVKSVNGGVIDGVFACGDLVDSIYQQAITAAGSGCQAALDLQRWLEEN